MVLVRDPEDAVISLIVRMPWLTLEDGLSDYVRFHRRILPYREAFIVAPFEDVASDFGKVIRRMNGRFGSTFREFNHTEENVAKCFEIIERHSTTSRGRIAEGVVGRPSPKRKAMKEKYRYDFRSAELASIRDEANGLRSTLLSGN